MSPSWQRTAPPLRLSTRRRWRRADAITARPAFAPTTTPIIMAPSCSIPMDTTSKPCATRPSDRFQPALAREHRGIGVVIAPRACTALDSCLTRFLHANRFPPPDLVRGHASLENAMKPEERQYEGGAVVPIEPQEDPPIKPGQPSEPPQESPPGSPRPEVPPPIRDPGEPPRPDELPGNRPDELPVRGPQGPRTPSPTDGGIADLPGTPEMPPRTM